MKKSLISKTPLDVVGQVFWQSPNPMSITRIDDGTCLEVNEAFAQYLNMSREAIIGRKTTEIAYADPEERSKPLKEIKEKGYASNIMVKVKGPDQSFKLILLNMIPIRWRNQRLLLTVGTDISRSDLALENHQYKMLIESLNSIDGVGVILIHGADQKNPSLFYVSEKAKIVFKKYPLIKLVRLLDGKESICLDIHSKSYQLRKISSSGNSQILVILLEPSPDADASLVAEKIAKHAFTARQREVALWVAKGYSNGEIAQKLSISEYTVKDHVKNILGVLGIKSRRELFPKLYNMR